MNRRDFESLRALPGKTISGPIRLSQKQATHPLLTADRIPIENDQGITVWMNINYNPETGTKGINVTLAGEGPICRLDVDGAPHGDAGRSHKHAVLDEQSVRRGLRDGVRPRPDLSGKSLRQVFAEFCATANITHHGVFEAPDERGDDA
ncbi:MAG: hypothetical protein IPO88_10770 [Nannocystis sp.]|uniref:hypothetical protein n=1 Tax=Nannocystis sp. TaxID=1962667 RepID=UPI00242131EE|nr:hypothetical protein [Nannocystis sp.]MBK9753971.1 hypothetical protein [Nannocystis sp.]